MSVGTEICTVNLSGETARPLSRFRNKVQRSRLITCTDPATERVGDIIQQYERLEVTCSDEFSPLSICVRAPESGGYRRT